MQIFDIEIEVVRLRRCKPTVLHCMFNKYGDFKDIELNTSHTMFLQNLISIQYLEQLTLICYLNSCSLKPMSRLLKWQEYYFRMPRSFKFWKENIVAW